MYPEILTQITLLSHESMLKAKYSQAFKDHEKVFGKTLSVVSISDSESECRSQAQEQMEGLDTCAVEC